ncbi:A24 family peptidase [Alcaligenaceae bacterium A4P071]|nr:A24 family peptidase [Alcaligenaceae bacterium A4P071]
MMNNAAIMSFPSDLALFWWVLGLAAVLGACVGSLLTRVIHRLPLMMEEEWAAQGREADNAEPAAARMNLLAPGDHCPHCRAPLQWRDTIPIFSGLLQRGRCRHCAAPVGAHYPIVEVMTAVAFGLCVWRFGVTWPALYAMVLAAALIALGWIDARTNLLPDIVTLPLIWLGLLVNLNGTFAPLPQAVLGAVFGYGFLWLVFHVFRAITGREGMGYGDFKLLAALGAWLGLAMVPWLLLAASLTGVVVGLSLMATGRASRGQALPFGPYLAVAGLFGLWLADGAVW